jgi:hypothetical protein
LIRHTRRPLAPDELASMSTGQRGWAWEDLNLRPHPYQLTAGNRCADRPFCRSRPTVGAEGMRSISPLVCVQLSWHCDALSSGPHARWYPADVAGPQAALRLANLLSWQWQLDSRTDRVASSGAVG